LKAEITSAIELSDSEMDKLRKRLTDRIWGRVDFQLCR
jgi:F0F1-type ATP synthase delta subunit